jgi:NTP pyrophosphatase (non-canonical NTP hydrolase)
MDFNTYQDQAIQTAVYEKGVLVMYPALGLCGEAGEVANKVKKIFRDDKGVVSEEKRDQIKGEIGDCLWYLAALARDLDINLLQAAEENIAKLHARAARGTLQGSGDNR